MYIKEQYMMYRLAYSLMKNEGYDMMYVNDQADEIWLEKYEHRISKVIRLIHKEFDWKNHLKADITQVFQRIKAMRRYFVGKSVELHNVYIAPHTPVDDWEDLKKPLQLNEKNSPKMKVFYITQEHLIDELNRFFRSIEANVTFNLEAPSELEAEHDVQAYKRQLIQMNKEKQEAVKDVFSFGKPFFTYLIMALNIVAFILFEVNGASTNIEHLIQFGAKFN